MLELTKNGIVELSEEERNRIHNELFDKRSKDYHYLAFDDRFTGFSPLNVFLQRAPQIIEKEDVIFTILGNVKRVLGLCSVCNLTLFALDGVPTDSGYRLELSNIDMHFKDILDINDGQIKTPYIVVDFGHGAENMDKELICKYLIELLEKSKMLKKIYIIKEPFERCV